MVIMENETCCCCFPIKTGLLVLVILSIPELIWSLTALSLVVGANAATGSAVASEVIFYGFLGIVPSILSICLSITWACNDTEKTRKNLVCAFVL